MLRSKSADKNGIDVYFDDWKSSVIAMSAPAAVPTRAARVSRAPLTFFRSGAARCIPIRADRNRSVLRTLKIEINRALHIEREWLSIISPRYPPRTYKCTFETTLVLSISFPNARRCIKKCGTAVLLHFQRNIYASDSNYNTHRGGTANFLSIRQMVMRRN